MFEGSECYAVPAALSVVLLMELPESRCDVSEFPVLVQHFKRAISAALPSGAGIQCAARRKITTGLDLQKHGCIIT